MLSCYLIGENHLVLECADILMKQGIVIYGIISPLEEAKGWTDKNKITYFENLEIAMTPLLNNKFDLLFSIVNSKILPPKLLTQARLFTINYHDSSLPRYAGVNATCWAILNNEKMQGVTWHCVNGILDGG